MADGCPGSQDASKESCSDLAGGRLPEALDPLMVAADCRFAQGVRVGRCCVSYQLGVDW